MLRWILTVFLALLTIPTVTDAVTVQLGHSATVSCHVNCSTVTWWSKGIEVFQSFKIFEFSEGKCTVAPEFKDRIECSEEKIRGGDVSLTMTSVVYNDRGWYYCSCDGKDQCDRRIEVLVPTTLSISFGGEATLPCYAETDKRTVDSSAYVLWEKDEQQVLKLENGKMSYGSGFEQRATVSTERYKKGDLSLTIDCVTFSDSGLYRCSLKDGEHGYPDPISLIVEAHQYVHHKKVGDSVLLDLVVLPPVMVYFKESDATADSWMCARLKDAFHCKPGYEQRAAIVNNSIMLSKLSEADSGTYTVKDVRSGEVVAIHKLAVIGLPSQKFPWVSASIFCAIIVSLLGAVIFFLCRQKRQRQTEQRKEQKQLEAGKAKDVTEQEELVQLSIQQTESSIRSPHPWAQSKPVNSLPALEDSRDEDSCPNQVFDLDGDTHC
ncbi:uncharacterized protein LOC118816616 [Colossoma macropomum]|uniref:uncharacterized protein LOC118816616 n=1 Tax=Colossoma macropomum TaxID=42526 RepID=UPI001865443D|nr:uncharacterized protein LOC118816616 [Colossoma macropomum]